MASTTDMKSITFGIDGSWTNVIDYVELETIISGIPDTGTAPPIDMILNAFRHFPFDKLRVIIVAQDPYPTPGEAHGLAFSSKLSTIPKSLMPIYACLQNTGLIDDMPDTADLTSWAKQGVLLLNKALTTMIGKRREHAENWDEFTDNIVSAISTNHSGPLYFMLWGNDAKKLIPLIDEDKHTVYTQIHPSPMAQASITSDKLKFINCRDFKHINESLVARNQEPINWNPVRITKYKVYWNFKSNGITTDVRSLTSWVATYKLETGVRVFVGGVVPFTTNKKTEKIEYMNDKFQAIWVKSQVELICSIDIRTMVLSNNNRIEVRQQRAAKCKHGETIILK